jgi:mannose-1-phosphate guanylyltransferase / mannose-6-phosphate isomerase
MSGPVRTAGDAWEVSAPDTRPRIHPVILAGGSGTRLWPMSRDQYPKQLISLLGNDSLLQSTAHRLDAFDSGSFLAGKLIVVANEAHGFMTVEQLRGAEKEAKVILEPVGRDTAPALTVAALSIAEEYQDGIMVVMPADHTIADIGGFHAAVATAAQFALADQIVALGVIPTRPETGYGYIGVGPRIECKTGTDAYKLERFVEKPHFELAEHYVASERYWWNSGIFILRAMTWLKAIAYFQPDIFNASQNAYSNGERRGAIFRLQSDAFAASPSNSIDYAVMERLANEQSAWKGVVVPLRAGWSDVGAWDAVWHLLPKDEDGNVGRGRVLFEGASSTLAHSDGRLIACVGTRDLIVVETPDAVLVADKTRLQEVKKVVGKLRVEMSSDAAIRRKVFRPWGYYETVDVGERFLTKRIVVNPGGRLSLQMHHHRSEHWIVLRGTGLVTCGEERFLLSEDESTYIPLGVVHRLENPGRTPLELIEIQSGSYIGEDDIVRFDDAYGRPVAAGSAPRAEDS